jgi:hypothetical protein
MLVTWLACASPGLVDGPDLVGPSRAGGAAWTGSELWVADAERNVVWRYDADGTPRGSVELAALSPELAEPADLAGLAVADDGTIWVVGGHTGGGVDGEVHATPTHRLVALKADGSLVAVGEGLIEGGQWTNPLLGIVENTIGQDPAGPSALAIGGVARGPDGSLVLGFRAPTHASKALIEQLRAPGAAVAGQTPDLVGPYWLDLGGAGIGSIAADGDGLRILAGSVVWRWGALDRAQKPVRLPVDVGDRHPDEIVRVGERWWVLSAGSGRVTTTILP